MFSKFKELFSSENLLDSAYTTTVTMLEFDQKMYEAAHNALRNSDSADLPFDIKKMDRKINKFEREVRRNVLTHLSVAGTANLVPGLVLVSIVIDVERLGDYTKNIVDLAKRHPRILKGGSHEQTLKEIEDVVDGQFPQVINIMKDQDKTAAREIMRAENEIGKKASGIETDMIQGRHKDLKGGDAVTIALYARYLKRINAHITNIASAIVNPFPRISFREKKKKSAS
ncbi:MAG: phosphate uptake regulator PhoU [bacterium]|nr:phosphate uptake regulator PhoU [bacterium]